jgi:hypothetical protein
MEIHRFEREHPYKWKLHKTAAGTWGGAIDKIRLCRLRRRGIASLQTRRDTKHGGGTCNRTCRAGRGWRLGGDVPLDQRCGLQPGAWLYGDCRLTLRISGSHNVMDRPSRVNV